MAGNRKKETEEEKQHREMVETIAENIEDMAKGIKALISSRLSMKAIQVLLANATQLPQATIKQVLEAAAELDKTYLKK